MDVITRSDCEAGCDQYNWCIAYTHLESRRYCHLFNSDETGSCPSGYAEGTGPTLTSIDQISGVDADDMTSACYAKPKGGACFRKSTGKTKYALKTPELQNHYRES